MPSRPLLQRVLPPGFVDDGTQPLERAITISQGPDGTEGAATATYLCSAPGEYRIHVALRGAPLGGSPFACTVAPSGIFPTAAREAYAAAAPRFAGGAIAYDDDTALIREAHQLPRSEHVARGLAQSGEQTLQWGIEAARTMRLLGDESIYHPHAYEAAKAAEQRNGIAGRL